MPLNMVFEKMYNVINVNIVEKHFRKSLKMIKKVVFLSLLSLILFSEKSLSSDTLYFHFVGSFPKKAKIGLMRDSVLLDTIVNKHTYFAYKFTFIIDDISDELRTLDLGIYINNKLYPVSIYLFKDRRHIIFECYRTDFVKSGVLYNLHYLDRPRPVLFPEYDYLLCPDSQPCK